MNLLKDTNPITKKLSLLSKIESLGWVTSELLSECHFKEY